jgi:hypothetical protein
MCARTIAAALITLFAQQPRDSSPARVAAESAIAAATNPSQCVPALQTFVSKRQQEVRPAAGVTPDVLKKVDEEKVALAKKCIHRFMFSSNPVVLPGMAELHMEAGEPDEARTAIDAAFGAMLSPATRAAALAAAVNIGLRDSTGEARNARLEKLADELDANPAATFDQQWSTHSRLVSHYREHDVDAGILKHGRWMAGAATSFTPEQRKQYGTAFVSSQVSVAEAVAGQGMNDQALALLRKTAEDWKDVPRAGERYIGPALERYSLVGTAAAPIKAARWLNAPRGTRELPMTGAVTLLEFTADGCGRCLKSYPGVNRLRQQFGAKGFRVVMATRDPNEAAYKVSGLPQIHLIDRKGRIRLIMIGYDEANEPKLAELIAKLLAEQ